jgi:hypothetical protein
MLQVASIVVNEATCRRVANWSGKRGPEKQKALLRFRVQRFFSLVSIPPDFYAGSAGNVLALESTT